MNGTAAIEQQQNAARRVFYMFIAMALLIIRAGVDARGGIIVIPPRVASPDGEPSYWIDSSRRAPDYLYPAAQRFLRLASAALKRLD
ncbi:hypothetical protein BO068_005250, partial [Escherichia coli]|nr:hypothetical protein [Escherichia coli]